MLLALSKYPTCCAQVLQEAQCQLRPFPVSLEQPTFHLEIHEDSWCYGGAATCTKGILNILVLIVTLAWESLMINEKVRTTL